MKKFWVFSLLLGTIVLISLSCSQVPTIPSDALVAAGPAPCASCPPASFGNFLNASKVAFVSNRDGGPWKLYVMDADGSNQTRLGYATGYDFDASVSPDGTKILFTSDRDTSPTNNYQI